MSMPSPRPVPAAMSARFPICVDLVERQFSNAVAVGFEIVDQEDVLNSEGEGQFAAIDRPRQVGEPQAPVPHGTGHTKASCGRLVGADKLFNDFFQAGVFLGCVSLLPLILQFPECKVVQRQVNLGAAHVAGQNHLSLSRTPRPSPSVAGRSAAAALSKNSVSIPLEGQMS